VAPSVEPVARVSRLLWGVLWLARDCDCSDWARNLPRGRESACGDRAPKTQPDGRGAGELGRLSLVIRTRTPYSGQHLLLPKQPRPRSKRCADGAVSRLRPDGMVLPMCLPKPTLHGCYRPVRTYNEAMHAGIPGVGSRATRSPTLSVFTSSPTWAVGRLGTSRFAFAFTGEMESAS